MRHPPLRLAFLVFLLAPALLAPLAARANWIADGNPVCTATGDQTFGRCVPDGSGGAFVAWLDGRRGAPNIDLYATRILADGTIAPGWPVNGAPLAQTGTVTVHSVAPDGAGGLMAFWFNTADNSVRMQHVDGSGALAPGFPADGLNLGIVVGGPTGYYVRAMSDEAGGAYILWNIWVGPSLEHMRLTRVTGTGAFASGWNATGVFQAGSDNLSSGFDQAWMTNDPTGGALVAMIWTVELQGPGSYVTGSYRRTPLDGAGGFSKGFGSPPNANVGGPLGIAPDGAGGAYLAWAVSAVPTRRMQHYSAGGTELWPNPTAAPVSDAAIADGSGGLYLFGRPPGFDRLEVHRRASDASIPAPWTSSGVEVSASGSYSAFSMIRSDVLLYAVWSHGPAGAHDLRASAVTANAALAPGWAAGGDVACDATGHQVLTDLIAMPPSEALAAWEDRRSDNGPPPQQTGSDIFVTRLPGTVVLDAPRWGPPGPATLAFSAPPSPNPARDRVAFTFTAAEGSAPTLEIVDVAGRVHGRLDAEARTGRQSLAFDTGSLAPGLYWARLRQGAGTAVLRFAVVR